MSIPTIATRTATTTASSSPGMKGAWLWEYPQQQANSGTAPQKRLFNLAMGRFGGIPADYTQVKPREGEIDMTIPTIATSTATTTGSSSPGMKGARLWEYPQQHANSATAPQKRVLNNAMGRFGGIPADYTLVKPRALLSDF